MVTLLAAQLAIHTDGGHGQQGQTERRLRGRAGGGIGGVIGGLFRRGDDDDRTAAAFGPGDDGR